jgi:hypothetical protein
MTPWTPWTTHPHHSPNSVDPKFCMYSYVCPYYVLKLMYVYCTTSKPRYAYSTISDDDHRLIQNERSASKQASKQASELIPAIDRVHSHAKYGTGTNTVRQGTDLDERDKEGI